MSYGVATQTGVSVAIQSIPSMSANKGLRNGYGATFAENFADGTNVLDPRITFSRASNATVTNSSGNIVYAPMNLLTYSEQFDNAAWTKGASTTVTANYGVAPDDTTTADRVQMTAGGGTTVSQSPTLVVGSTYTLSVYVRATSGTSPFAFSVNGAIVGDTTVSTTWTRLSYTFVYSTGGVAFDNNNLASDYLLWGAQLELRSSVSTYNSTTVKNLLGYSEAIDNAGWNKIRTAAVGNSTYAPNGTLTADTLTEDTNALGHYIDQTYAGFTAGTPYTFSIYAKNLTRRYLQLILPSAAFGSNIVAVFDLALGVCNQAGGTSVAITSVGNGWYRCSITATATVTISTTVQIRLANSYSTTPSSYTGDGASGVYIWGVQLADSGSLDPYVNNPVAAPSAAAYYGARFDYDPVTLQPKGLLIEEQRTNLLLNSKIDGTSLSTQSVTVSATAYSLSFYGTGSVVLSGTASATVSGTGTYPTRTTYTFTPTAGTLTLTVTGTVQYAQVEAGAFATSYIPTVASQVTRSADVALIQGSNFSGWYNATEGTIFNNAGFGNAPFAGSNRFAGSVSINDATANNYIGIGYTVLPASSLRYEGGDIFTGGVAQTGLGNVQSVAENTSYKIALAYKLNDVNVGYSGSVSTTDTSVTIPTVTQMQIGVGRGGAYLNGHIKSIAYYPTRLQNSQLQAITQ